MTLLETSLNEAFNLVINVLIFIGSFPKDIENSSRFFSKAVLFKEDISF
nr:MAG TPA: hypothetical protein [Bacteriophage sp.]